MMWTLLVVGSLVGVSGLAAAQFDQDFEDNGLLIAEEVRTGLEGQFGEDELEVTEVDSCLGDGGGEVLGTIADVEHELVREQTLDQEVDVDEDEVLLAIALANNGATDIEWEDIRDFELAQTRFFEETREADLDRDDVFSALALGLDADGGALDALACAADVTVTAVETTTASQEVDLEEDEVLLAIALSNSIGTDLSLESVADISAAERTELLEERVIDIDRDDTFLALALGAGGDGGGI